ncbi:DUF4400 domain-containing protein [Pseudomonas aeruginosa]|uniref:DUF4400 domain-containing protein n=1 Tax=Pseudomonas aeruginosa TaxID=287 RepID=UPI00104439F7|nr:DUF4400 domain-containing protein [Pseudomonas aeruginosa]EKU6308770.1 DUF4400 domain-containing protein [Pseudomonas aeruginosa]EKX2970348.1 DUF4400 domain-containing protein [Pseudomonas aeruginosa]HBO6962584.1 DUF4400 domain-containing protein [Pseudomonas aeruginosa]HBO7218249.1 DUF4400 domain-containing protein [Pseudomonas aeruginosa]
MSDFQEKLPTSLWGFVIFVFIEIILIVCLIPNGFLDRAILKEQEWGEVLMGAESHEHLINDTNTLYTKLMLDSGVNQMVFDFFVPTAEERERSKAWENLGRMWFSFIESRGEALAKVIYHIYYRALLIGMWLPYMLVVLVPSVFGGYMAWNIKRYNFDHSSPFLNTYSSKIIWATVAGILISFIAPVPIPPMVIPVLIITLVPIACSLLIGNLPKRL